MSPIRDTKQSPRQMARFVSPLELHDCRGLNLVPQQNESHSAGQAKNMKYDMRSV